MPPETFSLTINGVNGSTATAAAVDPLSGNSVPVTITATDVQLGDGAGPADRLPEDAHPPGQLTSVSTSGLVGS